MAQEVAIDFPFFSGKFSPMAMVVAAQRPRMSEKTDGK